MNKKTATCLLSVLAVLMIVLTACQANLQEQIIGQWKLEDENQEIALVFSFKDEGLITIWIEDIPLDGAYTWLDDGTIQITLMRDDIREDIVVNVQIDGDHLTITSQTGKTDVLTRVK